MFIKNLIYKLKLTDTLLNNFFNTLMSLKTVLLPRFNCAFLINIKLIFIVA